MKNQNFSIKPRKNKKLYLIIAVVLLLGVIGASYVFSKGHNQNQEATPANQDSVTDKSSAKDDTNIKEPETKTNLPTNSTSTTKEQITPAPHVNVLINDFAQIQHKIQASATIEGASTQGSCVFTFSSEGAKPVVRQTTSIGSAGPRNCTVSIPEVEFTKLGQWNLNITFYQANERSEANRSVEIQ